MQGCVGLFRDLQAYGAVYTLLLVNNVKPLYDAYTTYLPRCNVNAACQNTVGSYNVLAKLDTLEMAANALVSIEVSFKYLPYFALLLRKLSSMLSLFIDQINMLYSVYTVLLLFSLFFCSRNFLISPQSKAAPTLSRYLMDFEEYNNTCTNVWNNNLREFSFLQSKKLRKLVGGLPFGDIFVLILKCNVEAPQCVNLYAQPM